MSSPRSIEEVYDYHVQAFFSRDVNGLLEDYNNQSVIFTQQGVITGLEQMRGFFTQLLEMMSPESMANTKMLTKAIEGDVAFHTWDRGAEYPFGAETFVVRGGKIVAQTLGMYVPE